MRNALFVAAVVFLILGFFIPFLWVAAAISGILAVMAAPSGKRPDGKARTGGLLGGIWDDALIGYKMKDCPFCKSKIDRSARKCPHCGEWVEEG